MPDCEVVKNSPGASFVEGVGEQAMTSQGILQVMAAILASVSPISFQTRISLGNGLYAKEFLLNFLVLFHVAKTHSHH